MNLADLLLTAKHFDQRGTQEDREQLHEVLLSELALAELADTEQPLIGVEDLRVDHELDQLLALLMLKPG